MTDTRRDRLNYPDLLFSLGLATLLSHEMDAVAQAEWKVLPLTSLLPDPTGFVVFVALHVPILALVLWLVASTAPVLRRRAQIGVDGFLLIHLVLHWLFSGHRDYGFDSLLSVSLIVGAGVFGALHLLLLWSIGRRTTS